jgi:mono/diheme cytochrome c family protein
MLSRPLVFTAAVFAAAAHGEVRFNRDIRPIMAETCFRCHGPDRSSRMAGMRLDIREEALKATASGAIPIVPGDPDKSAIVQRVFATGARIMPPAFAHKELTPTQKDTIRQWVAEGAKYEGHWAYQPISKAEPPGSGNPIDAFIAARLAAAGLKQSPEADRRTLIRRVTLDLTGLPPAPEEIAAFEKDGDYE